MTEGTLDRQVQDVTAGNQRLGTESVRARLETRGHIVQRRRVRLAMLRVDPVGVALRSTTATKRRTYKVAGPNSLWHVDGNHKLIR